LLLYRHLYHQQTKLFNLKIVHHNSKNLNKAQ
jgi:hypothetical protein